MADQPRAGEDHFSDDDTDRFDRMWGRGNWLIHEGCPAALEAGQDRAAHHKDYHGG